MQLRPYQRDDVRTMDTILADKGVVWNLSEMRVGKLIELIALVERIDPYFTLVVAPLSTLLNVRDEFERWTGRKVLVNPSPGTVFTVPVIVAVNPEKLRKKDNWIFGVQWDLLALDECHRYRGRKSKQTEGAIKLASTATRLVLMTGTPLMNGLPREIYPLLHMTDARRFSHFWPFMQKHAVRMPGWNGVGQDERSVWSKEGKAAVQAWLKPYVVRRTFAEVRPELPALVEQTIKFDLEALDPVHRRLYQDCETLWRIEVEDQALDVPTKLALTTRLRQVAASPSIALVGAPVGGKVKAIADWVQDQSGKGVIWCWHHRMAEALYEEIDGAAYLVTGDTTPDERAAQCRGFQEDKGNPILVATIGSLKEGITLDTASWAAFAERSWLPADNEQAAMRIVGPNQAGSPLVTTFICESTIEESVERVLGRKGSEIVSFMDVFEEVKRGSH